MQTFDTKLGDTFANLVYEAINSLSENVASGKLTSIEDYKQQTGRIMGLREALELLDEAYSVVNGKPPDK